MTLSKVRQKAWETRRKKYGPKGHQGYCFGGCHNCKRAQQMEELIIKLYIAAVLSEGQASKATGLDRIQLRIKADDLRGADNDPYMVGGAVDGTRYFDR